MLRAFAFHEIKLQFRKFSAGVATVIICALPVLSGCGKEREKDKAEQPAPAPVVTSAPKVSAEKKVEPGWSSLFDGKTLGKWKSTNFGGEGEVSVKDGELILPMGATLTGVTYTGDDYPKMNYEIALEAKRFLGNDFFCGLTFPVNDTHASLILGGWGGTVTGISSIDGNDASSNDTTKYLRYDKDRWYRVRMRVTPDKLQAWLDDEQVVDVKTAGHKIDIRVEVSDSRPLGIATWQTGGALRNIRIRKLTDGK